MRARGTELDPHLALRPGGQHPRGEPSSAPLRLVRFVCTDAEDCATQIESEISVEPSPPWSGRLGARCAQYEHPLFSLVGESSLVYSAEPIGNGTERKT